MTIRFADARHRSSFEINSFVHRRPPPPRPSHPACSQVGRSRGGVANRAPSLPPSPREAERSPVSSVILSYGGLYHQFRRPGSGAASSIGSRDISAYLHETCTLAHPRVPPPPPPTHSCSALTTAHVLSLRPRPPPPSQPSPPTPHPRPPPPATAS